MQFPGQKSIDGVLQCGYEPISAETEGTNFVDPVQYCCYLSGDRSLLLIFATERKNLCGSNISCDCQNGSVNKAKF